MNQEFEDVNEAVAYYCKMLIESEPVKSTNEKNKGEYKNLLGGEVIQQFFTIKNPTRVLCTYDNHKFHEWWMYGEIISEMLDYEIPIMYKYTPLLFEKHYKLLDNGRMQYHYGSRWREFNQLLNIYHKLKKNINSKRCYVSIQTPYDTSPERRDSPCTIGYSFIHRDGKLNMTVFYRSWDFCGGFRTYDFALSSFVLQSMSSWLGVKPGTLGFYVTSLHYYNRDEKTMKKLYQETQHEKKLSDELNVGSCYSVADTYDELRRVKLGEEHAYCRNVEFAVKMWKDFKSGFFKDMLGCFIQKNVNNNKKR